MDRRRWKKAKKARGRVFAAAIFVAHFTAECKSLGCSFADCDLFVYGLAWLYLAKVSIADLSFPYFSKPPSETMKPLMVGVPRWARFGHLHGFAIKYWQNFARCKKSSWRLSPLPPLAAKTARVLQIIFATVLLHVPPKTPRGEIIK